MTTPTTTTQETLATLANMEDEFLDYTEPLYPYTKTEYFDEDNMKPLLNDTRFNKEDRKRLSDYNNLSIQEYRALLRNERLFLIVDKPLTRILPELHEDNDDFIINNKIIPSNNFQIKKKIQKKNQSKNNILNEKFGLTQ